MISETLLFLWQLLRFSLFPHEAYLRVKLDENEKPKNSPKNQEVPKNTYKRLKLYENTCFLQF